jgi:hypothetical protein
MYSGSTQGVEQYNEYADKSKSGKDALKCGHLAMTLIGCSLSLSAMGSLHKPLAPNGSFSYFHIASSKPATLNAFKQGALICQTTATALDRWKPTKSPANLKRKGTACGGS